MFMMGIENMLKVFNIGYLESSTRIIIPPLAWRGMMDSLGISVTKHRKARQREWGSKGPNRERESYFGARHSCVETAADDGLVLGSDRE